MEFRRYENKKGEEFGEERVIEFLIKNRKKSAEEINRKLFEKIDKFRGGRRATDDCTFILLKSG